MAKRKRKKIKSLKGEDSEAYFNEAVDLLRYKKLDLALKFAEKGKEIAKTDADIETANEIITEAHFRIALNTSAPEEQLNHLEHCLKYTPDESRFHFYKGIALLKQRNSKEALKEFQFVEDKEPDREGLSYFKNIASIDEEKDFDKENLSDKERNTLKIIRQFLAETPETEIDELPWNKVLGRYPKIWKALYEMKLDEANAPTDTLKKGVNINRTKSISSILQYYEGLAYFRKNNPEKARIIWQKILRGDFSEPWAYKNLMMLGREELQDLIDEKKWKQAARISAQLPEALKDKDSSLNDVMSYALFNLGYEASEKGKWNQALSYWKQARDISDNRYLAQNVAIVQEKIENWDAAAQAWRDVLRRRPRREDHPDYLTDKQVSSVWKHAGECYQKISDEKEAIYCFRKAIEYAPDNMDMRMELVEYLFAMERCEAAENEINNILEIDPENKQALIQLAQYYETTPSLDGREIWEKILAIDPEDQGVKDMIAESYIEKAESEKTDGIWGMLFGNTIKDKIKIIQQGLEILPDHPKLLFYLGICYRESNKNKKAKKILMEAYNKAPDDTFILGGTLHELVHLKNNKLVEKIIPELHKNPKVYVNFWIHQISGAAHCNLGKKWIMRFCEEALAHLEHSNDQTLETKASILFQILLALREENEYGIFDYYKIMVEEEVPNSGVLELIKAWEYFSVDQDISLAKRMVRKTKKTIKKTNDIGMMRQADRIEQNIDQLAAMLSQYIFEEGLEDIYELF